MLIFLFQYNIIHNTNTKTLKKISNFTQIWDRLPYLKAVVMYKDRVSEKHPNLYMVCKFMLNQVASLVLIPFPLPIAGISVNSEKQLQEEILILQQDRKGKKNLGSVWLR